MTFIEKSASLASNVDEARWWSEWRCRARGCGVPSWRGKFLLSPKVSARALLTVLGAGAVLGIHDLPL